MAKVVYWRNGNYASTITVNKQEKEFNAHLTFRNGNIQGNCQGVNGQFNLRGTFTTSKPFSCKIEMENLFGIPKIDFIGNHASDSTIFGTWSSDGVAGGDLWFRYKHLSPEEEEKQEKKLREQQIMELLNMGFEQHHTEEALKKNKYDLERAVEWLMQGNHLIDDSGDDPHERAPRKEAEPAENEITLLVNMGFSRTMSVDALKVSNCNVEQAVEFLFNQG